MADTIYARPDQYDLEHLGDDLPAAPSARPHPLHLRLRHEPRRGRFVSDFESHVYFPRELELLFRATGFTVEATWGDYRFGPFEAVSRQIIMAGRRPT